MTDCCSAAGANVGLVFLLGIPILIAVGWTIFRVVDAIWPPRDPLYGWRSDVTPPDPPTPYRGRYRTRRRVPTVRVVVDDERNRP